MKKSLILAVLGLSAGAVSSFGQGAILIDSYDTYGPNITYGAANLVGGNAAGDLVGTSDGFTVGIYEVAGTVAIGSDPSNTADPSSLSGGLTLATGAGSTATFANGGAGRPLAGGALQVGNAVGGAGGQVYTFEVVAYNGADYASSSIRGHSSAFQLTTSAVTALSPVETGTAMSAFSVFAVPEPSTFALAGMGLAGLLAYRRKQA